MVKVTSIKIGTLFMDSARSENLDGQEVMRLTGYNFYSAKLWVGVRPPCLPLSAIQTLNPS